MSVGFGRSVFERARDVGGEESGFVEAAFGALGDENGRRRGGVGEDGWEGELVLLFLRGDGRGGRSGGECGRGRRHFALFGGG